MASWENILVEKTKMPSADDMSSEFSSVDDKKTRTQKRRSKRLSKTFEFKKTVTIGGKAPKKIKEKRESAEVAKGPTVNAFGEMVYPQKEKVKLRQRMKNKIEEQKEKRQTRKALEEKNKKVVESSSSEVSDDDDEDESQTRPNETFEQTANRLISEASISLDISGLELEDVPSEMIRLRQSLIFLDVGFNKLTKFSDLLHLFGNLQKLALDSNKITEIPGKELTALTKLRELSLNGNEIVCLPEQIGELVSLDKLGLRNNKIEFIPPQIGYLTNLLELKLDGNPLVLLPKSMGYLVNLELLDCSGCGLESLPEEFSYMFRLNELYLGNNALEQLPETFGLLSRITKLNLCDNKLTQLPTSMGLMVSLQMFVCDGNPFTGIMEKVSRMSTKDIFEFLEERMLDKIGSIDRRQYLNTLKSTDVRKPLQPIGSSDNTADSSQHVLAPHEILQMREKMRKLREAAGEMIRMCDTVVRSLKIKLTTLNSLQDCVAVGNLLRPLKAEAAAIGPLISRYVTLQHPPTPAQGDDQLLIIKRTLAVVVQNVALIITGLGVGIRESDDIEILVTFVKHLKSFYSRLKDIPLD